MVLIGGEMAVPLTQGDERYPPMSEFQATLAGTPLKAIIKPLDADTLWEWYEARGKDEADPSWADVFPAAVALACAVVSKPELVRGKAVAELGAGLGISGLAASFAGAATVTLLDREPEALHCAMATAQLNGLPTAAVDAAGEPPPGAIRAALFDWTAAAAPVNADVVLASEVLYDAESIAPLAEAVLKVLKSPGADGGEGSLLGKRLLVADPRKERVTGCRTSFVTALEASGATVTLLDVSAASGPEGAKAQPVVLINAEWQEASGCAVA